MKKIGLNTEGTWYKGNLHTHSTNSDGRITPAEIVRIYKDHGYQFLAFTEHELYTHNRELSDEDFLVLPGVELSCNNPDPWRIYHILGIGRHAAGEPPLRRKRIFRQAALPREKMGGPGIRADRAG